MRVRKKLRRIKRLVILGGLIGGVVALRRAKAARDARTVLGPPATWPPLEPSEPPVAALGDLATEPEPSRPTPVAVRAATPDEPEVSDDPVAAVGDLATDGSAWVAAEDGGCPVTHPVKANDNSGIYHLPGSPHYARTRAGALLRRRRHSRSRRLPCRQELVTRGGPAS